MRDLANGWRLAALREIAEINPKLQVPSLPESEPVYFVPMSAVSEFTGEIVAPELRPYGDVHRKGFTYFQENDILLAKISPSLENGKIAIASNLPKVGGFGTTEFHVIRPRPGITGEWIYFFLRQQHIRRTLGNLLIGSAGQQRVPSHILDRLLIPFPSDMHEQTRIIGLFTLVDQTRKMRRQSVDEIGNVRTALFEFMFGDYVGKNARRAPLLRTLGDVVGGIQVSPTRRQNATTPYLRVANVHADRIVMDEIKRISVSTTELEQKSLRRGDTLVVEGHGNLLELGRAAVWYEEIPECVYQNHLIRVRLDSPNVLPEYLSGLINSSYGRAFFRAVGTTTSGLHTVSTNTVKQLRIPCPPISMQRAYVQERERLSTLSTDATAQAELLDDLLQSLLRRYFVVPEAADAILAEGGDSQVGAFLPDGRSRPIWYRLSETQRIVWQATTRLSELFTADRIQTVINDQFGKQITREHIRGALDLLVILGAVIRDGRRDVDRWRSPHPELDPEVEV